jgi:hypothetical protein
MTAGGKIGEVPSGTSALRRVETYLTNKLLAELGISRERPKKLIDPRN